MKKIIALALTALLLISLVACNSDDSSDLTNIGDYAAPSFTRVTETGVFTFKEGAGDTAIITGYTSSTTTPHEVVVPATVGEADDRIVVGIGSEAFKEASAYVTSVKLPETVTAIEDGAFLSCVYLEKITLPDALESIGNLAFYGCAALETVVIGENSELTYIGEYAFSDCKALESFTFTEKLETIATAAFKGSAISEAKLPASVKTIGEQAFVNCNNLNTDGCITLTEGVKSIGKHAFSTDLSFIKYPAGSYAEEYFGKLMEEETEEEATEVVTEEATTVEDTSEVTTVEDTSAEDTSVEDTSVEDTSVEDTSVEETPAE